nr:hypothetical transcript [Hymenolepis microstoma]
MIQNWILLLGTELKKISSYSAISPIFCQEDYNPRGERSRIHSNRPRNLRANRGFHRRPRSHTSTQDSRFELHNGSVKVSGLRKGNRGGRDQNSRATSENLTASVSGKGGNAKHKEHIGEVAAAPMENRSPNVSPGIVVD